MHVHLQANSPAAGAQQHVLKFIDVGGGGRFLVSPKFALYGDLKLNAAFGGAGLMPSVTPELGGQVGF